MHRNEVITRTEKMQRYAQLVVKLDGRQKLDMPTQKTLLIEAIGLAEELGFSSNTYKALLTRIEHYEQTTQEGNKAMTEQTEMQTTQEGQTIVQETTKKGKKHMATDYNIDGATLVKLDNFISLDAVREDGTEIVEHGYLGMRPINDEWVNTLAHTDHRQWPKVIVAQKPEGFVLVAGYHRREAARLIGTIIDKGSDKVPDNGKPENPILALPVEIREFSSDLEIVKFAHEDNRKHGLPPTTTSRTQYGLILLHEMVAKDGIPHFTEAAKQVGVSKVTLFKAWNKALKDAEKAEEAEEEEKEASTDEEKAVKRFASTLRTFYKTVVTEYETNEEVVKLIASFLTKEDDKGLVSDMANIMREVSKVVNKPSKKSEAKKPEAKKLTQPELPTQPEDVAPVPTA